MSASLFVIHQALQDLEDLRVKLLEDGDSEAVAVVDQQIREWLTADAAKVTTYVSLIRKRSADIVAAKTEKAYWDAIVKAAEDDVERLKGNALAVMRSHDRIDENGNLIKVTELKATPGGGLRRQGNGGVEPLDASGVVAAQWLNITVTLPALVWADLMGLAQAAAGETATFRMLRELTEKAPRTPATERIREALKQSVVCADCKGSGYRISAPEGSPCDRCQGVGTVPATIPGAKLLERGEHVRVFPSSKKELPE